MSAQKLDGTAAAAAIKAELSRRVEVLENARDEDVPAVANRVQFVLRAHDEAVHEHGLARHGLECQRKHALQVFLAFHQRHGEASDDETRPDHEGIADLACHLPGLLQAAGHS